MDTKALVERYHAIHARVRALNPQAKLLAVSKGQPLWKIEALVAAGHRDFGENYAQECSEKARAITGGALWHFIGHLQSNKINIIAPLVTSIHSVGSVSLLQKLASRLSSERKLSVFLEVNIDLEPTKSGFLPDDLLKALPQLQACASESLVIEGLMAIPKADGDSRGAFRRLRELENRCRPLTHGGLSMGMSSDFEAALEEGATHVRVGSSIFGARA